MHVEIGIIVKKESGILPIETASEFIEWLVKAHEYDYGKLITNPIQMNHRGIETAERLHMITRYKFFEGIKSVRRGIETWTDEEIWDGKKTTTARKEKDLELLLFRLHAANFQAYGGPEIHLYDREWSGTGGITSEEDYRRASESWNDKDYYIATADMHF